MEPVGFEECYAASFRALTTQLYVYTGDLELAHDLVQEAFCRALGRWSTIARYDDPSAWIRRVAFNLANSRWRRARTALAYLRRQREEHVVGPTPDRVAAVAALATLPAVQRRAVVLHYLAVRFTAGTSSADYDLTIIGQPQSVDIDHDGSPESAVLVRCVPQAAVFQVLVYDRGTDGSIRLVGRVLATPAGIREGVDVMYAHSIEATTDGYIRVDVGDRSPCCDTPNVVQHQWRTYSWNGEKFVQTGGPTSFGLNPKTADLTVSGPSTVLTRQGDGWWYGNLVVNVQNKGPKTVDVTVSIELAGGVPYHGVPAGCTIAGSSVDCRFSALRAGTRKTVRFDWRMPVTPTGAVHVWCHDENPNPDGRPDDNQADLPIVAG